MRRPLLRIGKRREEYFAVAQAALLAPRASRFSRDDVCAHDGEVIAGSLERLLGDMLGDEASMSIASYACQASLFVDGEDLMGRSELLLGTCNEALYLRPVNRVWLELLHAAPTSKTRLLCQTFSRKASLRPRRDSSSFLVRTV